MVPISACPSQGRAKIERPAPAGTIAPADQRQVVTGEGDVGTPARADARQLGLQGELLRAQLVGPDARRIDDVRGPQVEALAALQVVHMDAPGVAVDLQQARHVEPVGADGAEALGLAEDRQDKPRVVGLAVVEEVTAGRLPAGQRGQQLEDLLAADDPVARRAPGLLGLSSLRPRWRPAALLRASAGARGAQRRRSRSTDMTS